MTYIFTHTFLYAHFKIPRYQELQAKDFDEAIKFLGGVSNNDSLLTDEELYTLAWCYKAGELMRQNIKKVSEALCLLKSDFAPSFHSQGIEYIRTLEDARKILEQKTKHMPLEYNFKCNKWTYVLPMIRQNQISQF